MTDVGLVETPASTEAETTSAPESYVNPDGTFKDGWRNALPEDIRAEKSLESFKKWPDIAKSFVTTKKMVGRNVIAIPTETSGEAEWEAYYRAGGRPETAGDYSFKRPDELPEEYWNPEFAKSAQELFHKIGLSKKQAEALFKFNTANVLTALTDQKNNEDLEMSELKAGLFSDWGNAYDQKVHLGNCAIEEGCGGSAELKERIIAKLGNNPDFIRFAANMGSKFSEHKSPNFGAIPTPSDIQTRIDEIMQNPLYLKGTLTERTRLANQVMELRKKMAPKTGTI